MPYFFTTAQRQELLDLWNARQPDGQGVKFDDVYQKLIEFIEDSEDADVQVIETFLRGARQVNAGIGNFSQLIRAYTQRELELRGSTVPLAAGMEVSAEIKQGNRTVFEYLLSPVQRVSREAGMER